MAPDAYTLEQVLAVARSHPFYERTITYPPDPATVAQLQDSKARRGGEALLKAQKPICKKDLYKVIQRLVNDVDPKNTYRKGVYTSITGGGHGGTPLFFATDVAENRRHRATFGRFLRATGVIDPSDWVLSTHCAGDLYRSLDLMLEVSENAGATALAGGNVMSPAAIARLLMSYHVNVLAGDGSQIIQVVHHMSTLSPEERQHIRLDKIIYTSEVLTAAQRLHIRETLGDSVRICSVLGSAEAGPWAASNPDITGQEATTSTVDFVYDTRHMLVEILPASCAEDLADTAELPDGETGIIVQTSLCRLRNPLVRYMTGDVGSLHALPECARSVVSESDWPHLRILRLEGRDSRFGFTWDGMCFEFEDVAAALNQEEFGVLQWQVVLYKMESSQEAGLDVRLLCSSAAGEARLDDRIRHFFNVDASNKHRFGIVRVDNLDGLERSATGRKVMKFIDRFG
ncbi:Indoleacetate--lysine synthetase [Metarhizium anisopliae]|nr:Indoleacetate--lysine synthetase [Metarhizium anisopliae]